MTGTALADEVTPRHLTPRQAEIVARLVEATEEEVAESGAEGFSVRGASRRAGVAPATAYTYFSSKEHLIAETMWRRMRALPAADVDGAPTQRARVIAALASLGTFIGDEPAFITAGQFALLSTNPDVQRIRNRIAGEIHRRLSAALGPSGDPRVLHALELAYSGAMITAGMGHMTFEDLPRQLAEVAELLVGKG